jgi:hypothetical protein
VNKPATAAIILHTSLTIKKPLSLDSSVLTAELAAIVDLLEVVKKYTFPFI